MRLIFTCFLIGFSLIALEACSPYRMDIRQGNILEQKHLDQLKLGMTKGQVQYLLGRAVVSDSFSDDTWYYINTFKSGKTQQVTQEQLILTFENDALVSARGDVKLPEEFNQ